MNGFLCAIYIISQQKEMEQTKQFCAALQDEKKKILHMPDLFRIISASDGF